MCFLGPFSPKNCNLDERFYAYSCAICCCFWLYKSHTVEWQIFRFSTLEISPGWVFLQCRINDLTRERLTHTQNECLVCKEHKTFREFKVVKLISALLFSGIYKCWLTGSYPAVTQEVMVFKMLRDLNLPFSQDVYVLKRAWRHKS